MKKSKRIKRIALILIVVSMMILTVACGDNKPTINVYNWGDYIDTDIFKVFTEETGIKVSYDTFATNEDLYVKLKQGGSAYDVIFPSDYMIERMIREDLLIKIDKNNIPNISKVDPDFVNLDYDLNNDYSVPYMWGTVGIIYNKTMVNQEVNSWDILWDEKYKGEIVMLNSQRDTIAVSLKRLGYSMNTRNIDELEEAKLDLIKQKPLVLAYMGDEVKDAMVSGEAALAVVWSGDAVAMIRDNPDLAYSIPKEGTNLWFDAMVIPKNAKNKEGAEKFINFLARPDIAAMNAEYIGYSTPITEALELLDAEIVVDEVAYPSNLDDIDLEIFKDPLDIIQIYDSIWTDIKSAK